MPDDTVQESSPMAAPVSVNRRLEEIRPWIEQAAHEAGVDVSDNATLIHQLNSPRVRRVLDLIDRSYSRAATTDPNTLAAHNRATRKEGSVLLRQHIADQLAFARLVASHDKALSFPVDPLASAYQEALEHLLRRFRK